jgi:hypothetical protein
MAKKNSNIELVVRPAALSDVMDDFARFDNIHRTFDGKLVRAGRLVVLSANGKSVRVVARGQAKDAKGEIRLSSETRTRLAIKSGQTVVFTIAAATLWDEFWWAWGASNPVNRIAARLGLISVGLGFLGAALGAISLVK